MPFLSSGEEEIELPKIIPSEAMISSGLVCSTPVDIETRSVRVELAEPHCWLSQIGRLRRRGVSDGNGQFFGGAYKSKVLLDNVSFRTFPGKLHAILGGSGRFSLNFRMTLGISLVIVSSYMSN